jgi:hypothetical protein
MIVEGGDLSSNNRVFVGRDVSMNAKLFVKSDASINGNLTIGDAITAPGLSLGTTNARYNTILGSGAGTGLNTGSNNTMIGYQSGVALISGSNSTMIGNGATPTSNSASNEVTLGNSSVSKLRCNATTITSLSDARDKTNIQPIPAGLDFISQLNPVKFTWFTRDGAKVGVDDFGFIAQELLSAQESAGLTYPHLVSSENPEKLEASYATLIPSMVKAIQELKDLVIQQREEIDALKLQVR